MAIDEGGGTGSTAEGPLPPVMFLDMQPQSTDSLEPGVAGVTGHVLYGPVVEVPDVITDGLHPDAALGARGLSPVVHPLVGEQILPAGKLVVAGAAG